LLTIGPAILHIGSAISANPICEILNPGGAAGNSSFRPTFAFGSIRIKPGEGAIPAGKPLSDWITNTAEISCAVSRTYEFMALPGAQNQVVEVDGQMYTAKVVPGAQIGIIAQIEPPDGTKLPVNTGGASNGSLPPLSLLVGTNLVGMSYRIVELDGATELPEGTIGFPVAGGIPFQIMDAHDGGNGQLFLLIFSAVVQGEVVYQANACTPTYIPPLSPWERSVLLTSLALGRPGRAKSSST
ncbi:hypothetical protein, partial [Stenotrophomonas sp. HMWF023]|uniref:hypothetical protein n=1 Tax=Stenotrophomonas sp. HMWF023 TaxID=2056859 RepID=UPI0015E83E40